ncbi:hypothetical protein KOR42_23980 [Thalassoglobus neptunius]|uniref:Uncharacterized protein n=1 Tax=Thalassoglobus neptunius TaxID=1938619 RepID=A0A5C5X7T3_9PLAN|nr:hypothetical protein [Thalassoglobus neptunius]TWT59010.1 hypothetical protein KOR42_23980 [Thalassoglobus neptunius]
MSTHTGTEKIVTFRTVTASDNVQLSEEFEPKRGCRVINNSASPVSLTVYEIDPVSKARVICEDIGEVTISAHASKDLGSQVFACWRIAFRQSSGVVDLVVVSAE